MMIPCKRPMCFTLLADTPLCHSPGTLRASIPLVVLPQVWRAAAQPAADEAQGQLCDQPEVGAGGVVAAGGCYQPYKLALVILLWGRSSVVSQLLLAALALPCSDTVRWLGRKAEELGVEVRGLRI